MTENGAEALAHVDVSEEKQPKKKVSIKRTIIGAFLLGEAIWTVGEGGYAGRNYNGIYSAMGIILGGYFFLGYGWNLFLLYMRKKPGWHRKHMLSDNQFYHRFRSTKRIMFIMFMVQFFTMSYLSVRIMERLPVVPDRGQYPYDFMWFVQDKDKEYIAKLTEKYDMEVEYMEACPLSFQWGFSEITISEDTYRKFGGEELNYKR